MSHSYFCRSSILLLFSFFVGCTGKDDARLPDEAAYKEDTSLMINICSKFANEPDAKKLHDAADATQTARVISCIDYNEECGIYGKFLTLAIQVAQDGEVTSEERTIMRLKLGELKKSIEEGRLKLRKAWKARASSK